MPYSMKVARNIKRLYEEKGLEAQEFASLIGISKQALSNYDSGRRKWPIDILPTVADVLGVSLDTLYGRD